MGVNNLMMQFYILNEAKLAFITFTLMDFFVL